jgi:hypothetical protein
MEIETLTVERLQSFLDVFYEGLKSRRRYYHYNTGNRAKEIESIELKQCYVIKEFHNKKEDVLIVKYLTEENIVCSFSILLEKMREFEFIEGSPKRKVKPGLTLPCVS